MLSSKTKQHGSLHWCCVIQEAITGNHNYTLWPTDSFATHTSVIWPQSHWKHFEVDPNPGPFGGLLTAFLKVGSTEKLGSSGFNNICLPPPSTYLQWCDLIDFILESTWINTWLITAQWKAVLNCTKSQWMVLWILGIQHLLLHTVYLQLSEGWVLCSFSLISKKWEHFGTTLEEHCKSIVRVIIHINYRKPCLTKANNSLSTYVTSNYDL